MSEPQQKILEYISGQLLDGTVAVTPETDLLRTGLIDSLAIMRLVGFIENEFRMSVPAQDFTLENFSTINAMLTYIETRN